MNGVKQYFNGIGRDILERLKDFFLTMDKRGVAFIGCMLILIGIGIVTRDPDDMIKTVSVPNTVKVQALSVPEKNGMEGYQPIDPTGKEIIDFRISHYDPRLGGTNCGHWVEGVGCTSHLASGMPWQDYIVDGDKKGSVVACDSQYDFWTVFVLISPPEVAGRYVCLDRGGAIEGNWLDILHSNEGYSMPFGAIAKGYVEYSP